MKVHSLLFLTLCLVSMGMFVSCSSEDVEVSGITSVKPHRVSITVSTGTDETFTRMSMGADYKMTWSDGDALSVVYSIDGTNYADKFVLESKSTDGKTGTFTCESSNLPTSGNTTVGVYYPWRSIDQSYSSPIFNLYNESDVTSDTMESMGSYALMYALNITATNGRLPESINLSTKGVCFLHIPAGLTLFTGASGTHNIIREDIDVNSNYFVVYGPTECYIPDYKDCCRVFLLTAEAKVIDGVLQRDIYVPFFPSATAIEATVALYVSNVKFSWTLPSRSYTAGKIYKVNATGMPAQAF